MMTHKVIWREGMFIRPQHFQQQERYFEALITKQPTTLGAYGYGFEELTINQELLQQGSVVVESARGFFEDGTAFFFPSKACDITPLRIPESIVTTKVYLCLMRPRAGVVDVGPQEMARSRYHSAVHALQDSVSGGQSAEIELATLQLQLVLEDFDRNHYTCLAVLDITEHRADHTLIVSSDFIPPLLDVAASPRMLYWIEELCGLLQHRADVLAQRLTHTQQSEAAIATNFMLLQLMNRYETILTQLRVRAQVHPEIFFNYVVQLIAELSTYSQDTHRPTLSCSYQHDDLIATFMPLMHEIRYLLQVMHEPQAVRIELAQQNFGIYIGQFTDTVLLEKSIFVLGVAADVSCNLQELFPKQIKIASVSKIHDLVSRGVSGITLIPLSVVPRHIPYHEQFVYFRLDQQHAEWASLRASGAIALHISSHFPQLKLELWVIRTS